jgi:hypothetical protein
MRTASMPRMQKLLLLLLPLAIAACVERDTAPAAGADTSRVETYPSAPATATTPSAPATTAPAQRTTLPGRGEGELESRPPAGESAESADDMPDGSIDAAQTSEVERNRASSSDAAPAEPMNSTDSLDPTRDSAIIDESGATGFGGQVMTPESLGDGEMRPDDEPLMPADVVDAGPAMIP